MNLQKFTCRVKFSPSYKLLCTTSENPPEKKKSFVKQSHGMKMKHFFNRHPEIDNIKQYIPKKYLESKRKTLPDNIYLMCSKVAKEIAQIVLPEVKDVKNQVICETNPGLGFISAELLENGVPLVRMYESCPEFREMLKDFDTKYPGRVEIFTKDLYLLDRYAWLDKMDHYNRVDMLLKNVPKKNWSDDPCMTIIGPMSKINFLRYLMKILPLQADIISHGRIKLFAIMRPKDYHVLTAMPQEKLITYKWSSVLFNLFFDYKLINKYPKEVFLPWESKKSTGTKRGDQVDSNFMYLVKIEFKKDIPVPIEDLLPLYYFAQTFFHRGKKRILPTVEKWVPGSGLNILLPKLQHSTYFNNIDIMTTFCELDPQQVLGVFREMKNHKSYEASPFHSMVQTHLTKIETIETDLNDSELNKTLTEEIQVKLDNSNL
ncbi:dimethyladenosine transferase 2, mitochondrial [Aethina tumida]|uniref:dimethyladenosine transferase 2, mitochondrial n=1 Tax=Aethina tumida TaxID=116153 RepID=UPI0021486FA9|nr:dimethyladenosine transferase 2, mitochondrial [Aethina tumida]